MGLTKASVGKGAAENDLKTIKRKGAGKTIALAGNPNVGKSTVFNALTGMDQHTGNWSGKTVTNAVGYFKGESGTEYCLIDIPGTYSLYPVSMEEEVSCDLICFGQSDCIAVVCDASCLERNLSLVLQISEISENVIVCLNLMDEAERKGIKPNVESLEKHLGLPVVSVTAKKKKTLTALVKAFDKGEKLFEGKKRRLTYYGKEIENEISFLSEKLKGCGESQDVPYRWIALKLLENDEKYIERIGENYGSELLSEKIRSLASESRERIMGYDDGEVIRERIMACVMKHASDICKASVKCASAKSTSMKCESKEKYGSTGVLDKLFTGKYTAFPLMILFLMLILWITISGANFISDGLAKILFGFEPVLKSIFAFFHVPLFISAPLTDGVYHVLAWVISVMLPPMAIFFPLFSLLEDVGYLPRIAYSLDRPFCKCGTCGKQALTMCMGFGCNAAGVVGCRIIDSPRERILAMITNNFMICNGRFPILITLTSIFFCGIDDSPDAFSSFISAGVLTLFILLGICATFTVTKLLSFTLLKGLPSSFTLELPSYRTPDIGAVIVRSVFDRTIFVLGRAAAAAAPAGLIIWLAANVTMGESSLLEILSGFFDPLGRLMGMDGVMIMAFILGFSANETVIPIAVMAYTSGGILAESGNISVLSEIFTANGWTWVTAVSVMIFTVMHWPCSTTLITIYKESKSVKWTLLSFIIPTLCGVVFCIMFNMAANIFLKLQI